MAGRQKSVAMAIAIIICLAGFFDIDYDNDYGLIDRPIHQASIQLGRQFHFHRYAFDHVLLWRREAPPDNHMMKFIFVYYNPLPS